MVAGFSDEVSAAWSTRAVAPGGSYCDRRVGTDIFAQCAQGKDFSRVTERVPPIFRSIENNGSSAAISRKAGGVSEMHLATLLLLLSRPSPSLRVWTMVYVRTETAARNSRPAVSQNIGVLVVTSWDGWANTFCIHSVV